MLRVLQTKPREHTLALAAVVFTLAWARFAAYPLAEKACRVPDDGFYYLTLGRAYAQSGVWTFDNGVSTTTGFHPLYAVVSAGIMRLFPSISPDALLSLHGALGFLCLFAAAWLLLDVITSRLPPSGAYGAGFVLLGGACLCCPLMAMEWPYAVLGDALVVWALFARRPESRARIAVAFASGALAIVARTDAIVPVACYACVLLWFGRRSRAAIARGAAALTGAAVGTMLVAFYFHAVSGSWTQGSARMKTFWRLLHGREPLRLLGTLTRTTPFGWWLIESPNALAITAGTVVLAATIVLAVVLRRRAAIASPPAGVGGGRELVVAGALAATTTLGAYMYGLNGGQAWYTAHFVAPVAILCAAGLGWVLRSTPPRLGLAFMTSFAVISFFASGVRIWRHQRLLVDAGRWVSEHPLRGAAWNAGVAGFFSNASIVNLDGLVNDDIHGDVFQHRSHCYVLEKRIEAIVETDCSGADPDRPHFIHPAFDSSAHLLHGFGRVDDQPECFVGVWTINRDELTRACAPCAR